MLKGNSFITKVICIALCLPILLFTACEESQNPPPAGAGQEYKSYVSFIDTNDGESIFIKLPDEKTVLIDCGTQAKGQKVVDFLKSKSINKIDFLIITHPDGDHAGGAKAVLENFLVENTWYVFRCVSVPRKLQKC